MVHHHYLLRPIFQDLHIHDVNNPQKGDLVPWQHILDLFLLQLLEEQSIELFLQLLISRLAHLKCSEIPLPVLDIREHRLPSKAPPLSNQLALVALEVSVVDMEVGQKYPEFLVVRRYATIFEIAPHISYSRDVRVLALFQINLDFLNIKLSVMPWLAWV